MENVSHLMAFTPLPTSTHNGGSTVADDIFELHFALLTVVLYNKESHQVVVSDNQGPSAQMAGRCKWGQEDKKGEVHAK